MSFEFFGRRQPRRIQSQPSSAAAQRAQRQRQLIHRCLQQTLRILERNKAKENNIQQLLDNIRKYSLVVPPEMYLDNLQLIGNAEVILKDTEYTTLVPRKKRAVRDRLVKLIKQNDIIDRYGLLRTHTPKIMRCQGLLLYKLYGFLNAPLFKPNYHSAHGPVRSATLLGHACELKIPRTFYMLFALFPRELCLNSESSDCDPLCIALMEKQPEFIRQLLEAGASDKTVKAFMQAEEADGARFDPECREMIDAHSASDSALLSLQTGLGGLNL